MTDYNLLTDEDIAQSAQGGDEHAAEFLLRKYKNMVNIVARRFYIVGAEQEDVIQEGMIGLNKAMLNYKQDKTKFSTFAYKCIRRSIIDALRASLSGKHSALNNYKPFSDFETCYIESDNPEQIILREEQIELLWKKAGEMLSKKEFAVCKLYTEGLSIREIAESLGNSYKFCDNALQRIRNKLRQR